MRFSSVKNLTAVTVPTAVQQIGSLAFATTGLAEVNLPEGLTSIGFSAFSGTTDLKSIHLPDSLTSLESCAFYGSGLEYVELSANITTLGAGTFADNKNLIGVYMDPTNAHYVSDEAGAVYTKDGKTMLVCPGAYSRHFQIPEGVVTLGGYTFIGCGNITQISIPESVTTIAGPSPFTNCTSLKSLIIPDSIRDIPLQFAHGCTSLEHIELPAALKSIGDSAFYECSALESIVIPERVTQIDDYCFIRAGLKDITFTGNAPQIGDYIFSGVTATAYYPANDPTWTEEVLQDYGGNITWIADGDAPELQIVTAYNLDYILGGRKLQLTALLEDGSEADVLWNIHAPTDCAQISSSGKITTKTVQDVQIIQVQALDPQTGAMADLELKVLPKDTKLDILLDGQILTDTLVIDMKDQTELELTAQLNGETVPVTWNAEYNWVEDGLVTLICLGMDTITAVDPYGITGTVTLDVYYLDRSEYLDFYVDLPEMNLQCGETVQITVLGTEQIPYEYLVFSSSDESVATVDSQGIITGVAPGDVWISFDLVNDPLGRCVSFSLRVVPEQVDTLEILYEGESVDEVVFDVAELDGESYTFTLEPFALILEGNEVPLNDQCIQWTCSNTKLASLKPNADGSVTVTVKAGVEGFAEIAAQTTDLAEVTDVVTLAVIDRAPKLGSNSVTLNPAQESGASVVLVSSYDNDITDVYVDSDVLDADYDSEAGLLWLYALEEIKNGTIKTTLTVTCEDGYDYDFALKVTIKNSIPSITVKQMQKLDLFYTDSEAELSITAKDAQVDWNATELMDTDDFQLENGILTFTDTLIQGFAENSKYKPDTKATLLIYLEDYLYPVEKSITIGTSTSKITLTTDPGSSIINTAMSTDYRAYFHILNKSQKEILPLIYEDVLCDESYNVDENGEISISFEEARKGTVTLYIQKANWMKSVKVTHKVSVEAKLPTVKLSATSLKLSNLFRNQTAIATAELSQGNMNIVNFSNGDVFVTTAKEGTDAAKEAAKISVTYDGGRIYARIKAGKTPKAGTYTYTGIPYVVGEGGEIVALKAVTIKVNVNSTAPKIKLGASTVKLNTLLMGDEVEKIPVTLTDTTGYGVYLHTFNGTDTHENVQMHYEDGMLYVSLLDDTADKYSFTLTPVVRDEAGSEAKLPTVKLTVQSYENSKITVSQSAKGKLDTLNPNSTIVYTISKLTNVQGTVDAVELLGCEDVFEISPVAEDAKGKQFFTLKLKADAEVLVNENYQLQFRYSLAGITVDSAVQKVKVTQSTVKASAPAVTFFQAQTQPMYVSVTANAPIDKIVANRDKTAKELVQAMNLMEDRVIDVANVETVGMNLNIPRPGSLTPGKTYKLVLDVIPVGNAANAKITQVTVNVKISK